MLMTMKLHLQLCKHPRELLGVSLNHVDGVRAFITRVDVLSLLNNVRSLLMTVRHPRPCSAMCPHNLPAAFPLSHPPAIPASIRA